MAESGTPNTSQTEPKKETQTLTVTVQDVNGNKTFFKIRPDTRLGKVFNAYCKRIGVEAASRRFMFEGRQIKDVNTPADIELEDGDCLDVYSAQTGGAYRN